MPARRHRITATVSIACVCARSPAKVRCASPILARAAATVQAATDGNATAIDGDIPPASWGYNPDVTKYALDVAQANQLIQASGWVKGADGVVNFDTLDALLAARDAAAAASRRSPPAPPWPRSSVRSPAALTA